ncbi:hypothetical protein MED92_13508 [Neptuniibacter caesariensis]|uniref:Uncharacterized protein n=1 Tax=Neptuniibacter caesariensis TaxID=207954 RepID=A0A7U8C5Y0_NEPCE|nr:hypothetical protein MED92_13508 [Neptuniibacter caesariensis]
MLSHQFHFGFVARRFSFNFYNTFSHDSLPLSMGLGLTAATTDSYFNFLRSAIQLTASFNHCSYL